MATTTAGTTQNAHAPEPSDSWGQTVIGALRRLLPSLRETAYELGPERVPYPRTWLLDGRWDDEPPDEDVVETRPEAWR